jgi:hypothetical protein
MPKKTPTQAEINREVQRDAYSQPSGAPASAAPQRWVTVVIALNPLDYKQWCIDHGKNPGDRNFVMATPASIRGLRDARLEVTPQGMWRPDIHLLMKELVPGLDRSALQKLAAMGWALPATK